MFIKNRNLVGLLLQKIPSLIFLIPDFFMIHVVSFATNKIINLSKNNNNKK